MIIRPMTPSKSMMCIFKLIPFLLSILLMACENNSTSDLDKYIQQVKARPKKPLEKLPDFKLPDAFTYQPGILRDPFNPVKDSDQRQNMDIFVGNGIRPDFRRRKEALEAFPLDALKMVGTVVMGSKLWGLVKAADKTIHRVQVGNYMGKNYGKILQISTDKMELIEIVPDKPGTWREQQTTLALAE